MADKLSQSWSALSTDIAARYMKGYGFPAEGSRILLGDLVSGLAKAKASPLSILELGCGNGAIYEYFLERGIQSEYVGVDFSTALLDVARANHAQDTRAKFELDDVNTLDTINGRFDVAIYSHVLELLRSPEMSLRRARVLADRIVIRFYEPPDAEADLVELRDLEVADGRTMPYLRRSMSRDYYRLILSKIGCTEVDIYHDPQGSKDQLHVLHFDAVK
jgi:ubiquinone/menaquinone biosynthesis C-methylase UbiE